MQDNMDVDSDKSLQEELVSVTAGQVVPPQSDDDPIHKVCYMFLKSLDKEMSNEYSGNRVSNI
jgi:hypothetical protein